MGLACLAACGHVPSAPIAAARVDPAALPGWEDEVDHASLARAIDAQCRMRRPPAGWPALCAMRPTDARRLPEWISRHFSAWPLTATDGNPVGLITGYYEPVLTGSRTRDDHRQTPLYRRPVDMVATGTLPAAAANRQGAAGTTRGRRVDGQIVPYWTRAEIEAALPLAGTELAWIDDRVAAFFLHIQGSGRIALRDGATMRVGFADHNGHPYRAIGQVLIARGALTREQADADGIRRWLRDHPAQAREVMHSNARYVFFRELPALPVDEGPIGSLGVALTAMRSVATDPARVPPGALLYLDTVQPNGIEPLRRIVLSQDTGAAITGPVRADLYWGTGDAAGHDAGRMRSPGRLWLLWPADGAPPINR